MHSGKTSRGFPLRALAFLGGEASRPPPFRRAGGHSSRRNTSKKTRGVEGLPQFSAVAPSGVSQQRRVRELVGAPERPSLRHVASRGTEVFVQRANGGREETREAQQGVFAFARACSVCQVGLRKTFSQAHQQQKNKTKNETKDEPELQIRIPVPFSETYSSSISRAYHILLSFFSPPSH